MKKNRLNYALVDPSSGGYSASRIASLFMVLLDAIWMTTAVVGLPPKEALGPVSSMLSACTAAAFTAYGLNSALQTLKQTGAAIVSSVIKKTTTTVQDEGPSGEAAKKTITVESQVDSGPKAKPAPTAPS